MSERAERFHMRMLLTCRCGKPATVALFNEKNAEIGRFCAACGKRELKRLQDKS